MRDGEHVTVPLARRGHQVLGVDAHELSISEARSRHVLPNLSFQAREVEDLVRNHLLFDVIVCSEVLEHLHRPQDFLIALNKLLRPDGALIITTPNGYGSYELLCRLERGLRRIGVHQFMRGILHYMRRFVRLISGPQSVSNDTRNVSGGPSTGFLNADSVHVQFFRFQALKQLIGKSGFCIVSRRARTFLCGPYIDVLLNICPFRQTLFGINSRLADTLPFTWAADWMFLLKPDRHAES